MMFVIQIAIWTALFKSVGPGLKLSLPVSLGSMITYTLISTVISLLIGNSLIGLFNGRVRSGDIAMDLLKPLGLKSFLYMQSLGTIAFRIITMMVPTLIILLVFFNISLPPLGHLLPFFLSLVGSLLIYFQICFLLGLSSFWYFEIWHFERLLEDAVRILSGSLIPIWFFPKELVSVSAYLPFKFIYYEPISIYLNKVGLQEAWSVVLNQCIWLGILILLEKVIWRFAVRKLVVQGG